MNKIINKFKAVKIMYEYLDSIFDKYINDVEQ